MQLTFSQIVKLSRPRTLPISLCPVVIGSLLAWRYGGFNWVATLLCAGVAVFAQIASNMANDYFDYKNGFDSDLRQGPERIVASGKVSPRPVLICALIFVTLSCLCGLGLLFYAPWWIIPVGIAIALCVFAYSAGPYPLSQHALGEVTVFIFYGIIPVCFTYFVQTGEFSTIVLLYSMAAGCLSANVLIVNNYRDMDEDASSGKKTIIVLWGRKFGKGLYLFNLLAAVAITLILDFSIFVQVMGLFLIIGLTTFKDLSMQEGKLIHRAFANTARDYVIYTCSLLAVILFTT